MNMKKILILAVVALSAAGCFQSKDRQHGPEDCVQAFYKALCAGDFTTAESLCDSAAMEEYIDGVRSVWTNADSTVLAIACDILSEVTVEITDIEKDGQNRTISYKLTSSEGEGKEKTATLRKEEGEWRIEQIIDRD